MPFPPIEDIAHILYDLCADRTASTDAIFQKLEALLGLRLSNSGRQEKVKDAIRRYRSSGTNLEGACRVVRDEFSVALKESLDGLKLDFRLKSQFS